MTYIVQAGDRPSYGSISNLLSDGWPEDTMILELDSGGEAMIQRPLSIYREMYEETSNGAGGEPGVNWQAKFEKSVSAAVVAADRHRATRIRIEQERDVALEDLAKETRRASAAESKWRAADRKAVKLENLLDARKLEIDRLAAEVETLRQADAERREAIMKEMMEKLFGGKVETT